MNLLQTIKSNIRTFVASGIVALLILVGGIARDKIYFVWHLEHSLEMIFAKSLSEQYNKDRDKLYVIMENEVSGEVKYIVNVVEDRKGNKWGYISDLWIMYPISTNEYGVMTLVMEHEGDKRLFPK